MKKQLQKAGWARMGLVIIACLYCLQLGAQTDSSRTYPAITPNGLYDTVVDRMGNKYPLVAIAVSDTLRGSMDSVVVNTVSTCSSGYFQLYLEPGCGMDNDSDPGNVARRNVLCRVLYDISQFIYSPLATSGNKINVWVRKQGNVPGAAGSTAYATSFYLIPNVSGNSEIADNVEWSTLHAGSDAYKNIANPGVFASGATSTFFHVIAAFDFNDFTWHTDLTTAPAATEYDLYTVALREVMHSLGIASEISGSGTSLLGNNCFSRYDRFLQTHSGVPLIAGPGTCTMSGYTFNPSISAPSSVVSPYPALCVADSTNCDTAIKYAGSVTLPVYTPNCFEPGISLSNFEDECYPASNPANNNLYFVVSNVTNAGSMKRFLKPEERLVLGDIGYSADTVYGNSADLNFYDYGGTATAGIEVAGVADGLAGGSYIYFSSQDGTVHFNGTDVSPGLLDNDVNANAFECLQVVSGSGTLSATSGTGSTAITYTPALGEQGNVLLQYVPVNTITGHRGNITAVSLLVTHSTGCPAEDCQLVENGHFNGTNCGSLAMAVTPYPNTALICNWLAWLNTPDLYSTPTCSFNFLAPVLRTWYASAPLPDTCDGGITLPVSPDGGSFVGLWGGYEDCSSHGWAGEAVSTQLAAPLIPGGRYHLQYYASVGYNPGNYTGFWDNTTIPVQLYVSPSPFRSFSGICTGSAEYTQTVFDTTLPAGTTTLTGGAADPSFNAHDLITSGSGTWQTVSEDFVYTGPASLPGQPQFLGIVNASYIPTATQPGTGAPWTNSSYFNTYLFIDGISITPVLDTDTPTPICLGSAGHLAGNYLVMDTGYAAPADTFAWTPATDLSATTGQTVLFTPVATGSYTVTVSERLYSCTESEVINVGIYTAPITGITTVCSGYPTTLSDATTGGVWSSSASSVASVGTGSGVVTGVSAGTVIITYMVGTSGCYVTTTIMVNPSPAAISGPSTICTDATITLTDGTGSGIWSSSATGVATIGSSTGMVTGAGRGTAIITYALATGCFTTFAVADENPYGIGGDSLTCIGVTIALGDGTAGGTWSSGNTAVASVGSTGEVTGVSGGTAAISYIMPTGCFSVRIICVLSPITGPDSMCAAGATIALSDVTAGGIWTSALVTVGSTGVATSSVAGAAIVTYTIYPSRYPYGCSVFHSITVIPLPGDIGPASGCDGATITLTSDSTDGVWSSTSTAVATVGSVTGLLTGVSVGTTIISYKSASTGCIAYKIFTVLPPPGVFTVTGGGGYCTGTGGADIELDGSQTGVNYQLYDGGTATGSPVAGTGGVLDFGLHPAGTYTVRATSATTGCSMAMTGSVTTFVSAGPDAITGASLICPGATATLSDATAGGVWSSGNTAIGTVNSGGVVTGIAGGVVTISYAVSGCAATYSFTVYPGSGSGACTPCSYFGTAAFTTLGPVISTNLSAGNYYAPVSVTAYGALTFTDAIIMMAAGDTMYLDTAASLTLDGSHLFSCNMWQGMRLESGSTRSAQLTVTQSTLIEDAMDAVYAPSPVAPAGGGYAVDCDNAVFNRNVTGIDIEYYNSLSSAYPFLIRNTVITGRDFSGYPGYPAAWPGAASLKAYYWDGSVFDPPFYLQNYLGASCKDGQGQYIGIKLDSVGADTSNTHIYPGVALPQYFSDIVIGDTTNTGSSNKYSNLLDNLEYGIYGLNSNMTVVNSAFTNIYNVKGPTYPYGDTIIGGNAIYAYAVNDAVNHDRLRVYAPQGGGYHNRFYGFTTAVACYNYVQVIGLYNNMINAGTGSSVFSISHGPTGACGYLVESAKYDSINISYDTISNVNTGISFWALQDPQGIPYYPEPAAPWQYSGSLNINYNVIQASPLGYSTTMTQLLSMGISVQNILSQSGTVPAHGSGYAGKMNVNSNYLYDVYDGIYVNNFARQQAVTSANTITLRAYPQHRLQYGINHTLCRNSQMYYNMISGDIAAAAGNDSMRATYASSNTGIGIACNTETGLGRGYEFYLKNPGTAWHDNTMNNNGKGMILNGAIIGTQHYGGYPMNNQWLGSWSSTNAQTYVYNGANAINDTLLVLPGSTTQPTINEGAVTIRDYSAALGSIQVFSGAMFAHAPFCGGWIDYDTAQQNQGINLYQQITQQQILYPDNVIPNNWIGQFAIWQNIVADTTLIDSSTILAVFASFAQNSRYSYITNMETQLAQGNFDSVETMLGYNIDSMANTSTDSVSQVKMADGPGADFIVENYQQFYSLYMKYIEDTLNSSDSLAILALAGLCPELNGTVVYQARALYSAVYNDLSVFNDDSCMDVDSTYSAERHAGNNTGITTGNSSTQSYSLYPNPNDGNMVIKQLVNDLKPINIEITNIVGQSIYKGNLIFNGNLANLQLNNLVSGMYLLQLTDSQSRAFEFKFVISKL